MPAASGASGPTSVKSTLLAPRAGELPVDVGGRDGDAGGELGDARIARCGDELDVGIVLAEAPGERVLASASADDQYLHRLLPPPPPRQAELNASLARLNASPNWPNVWRVSSP